MIISVLSAVVTHKMRGISQILFYLTCKKPHSA